MSSNISSQSDLSTLELMSSSSKKPQMPQKFESKEKLEKAAKEFEGVFMDLVMKNMREAVGVGENTEFGDPQKVKFFQSMLDSEYSKAICAKKKLGLADAIIRQFSPKVAATKLMDGSEKINRSSSPENVQLSTKENL